MSRDAHQCMAIKHDRYGGAQCRYDSTTVRTMMGDHAIELCRTHANTYDEYAMTEGIPIAEARILRGYNVALELRRDVAWREASLV